METEQAIKISLCHSVAVKAVEVLLETIGKIDIEDRTHSLYCIEDRINSAEIRLSDCLTDIREYIEPIFDAEDEQAIIDLVCNIEKALNQRPIPVPVHPEISNILNRHLGEK